MAKSKKIETKNLAIAPDSVETTAPDTSKSAAEMAGAKKREEMQAVIQSFQFLVNAACKSHGDEQWHIAIKRSVSFLAPRLGLSMQNTNG